MTKYLMLLDILDRIREESTLTHFAGRYLPAMDEVEKLNQARARAFTHLFLKVRFGILDFAEREHFVTDGPQDGGIDGYFIQRQDRTIYLLQSKFRTTRDNFETKEITLSEILAMDITRVLGGEQTDERGISYNGKIQQLAREIRGIDDIGRYSYHVVILANLHEVPEAKLRQLTGGYAVDVLDYDRCYRELVFPVLSGTYFNATDLSIYIDLSNKNAGSKISYTVTTAYSECEITVLFVPTLEIAKILSRYKNSILRYNPRSYLELDGQKVNAAIRGIIVNQRTNEFALFNNGITMLSDETYINERIGQKNKAQLTLKNPQIINGGQTAYTLSRIFEEDVQGDPEGVFAGKEVLLKVITLLGSNQRTCAESTAKLELIDQISAATNQQTAVINADRHSNEQAFLRIQTRLFDEYGILFERKRGEFADGVHKLYINKDQVLERNLFFRLYLAANGEILRAAEKKLFIRFKDPDSTISDSVKLERFYFAYLVFLRIGKSVKDHHQRGLYGKLYAMTERFLPAARSDFEAAVKTFVRTFSAEWEQFLTQIATTGTKYFSFFSDTATGERRKVFSRDKWIRSRDFEKDVKEYFKSPYRPARSSTSHPG